MSDHTTQKQAAVDLHSNQADLFASRYTSPGNPYRDCFTYSRHRLQLMLDRYLPSTGNQKKLLDVGCGTGSQIAAFRHLGYEVSGIDASAEMLNHARALNPGLDIRQADVDSLPYSDGTFDYVVSIEVLRYLPEPEKAIAEMARVLRPGGMMLATAAPRFNLNGYWVVNRLSRFIPFGNFVTYQQSFVTSMGLRNKCRQAGFQEVQVHGVYFGPINWVERLTPGMLPGFLKGWERIDRMCADATLFRELSNMFLVQAIRKPSIQGQRHAA